MKALFQRTFIILILASFILLQESIPCFAETPNSPLSQSIIFCNGSENVLVKGSKVKLPDHYKYFDMFYDNIDRNYFPLDLICSCLGAKYTYNSKTKAITITYGTRKISMKSNSFDITVNGKKSTMDWPVKVYTDIPKFTLIKIPQASIQAFGKSIQYFRHNLILIGDAKDLSRIDSDELDQCVLSLTTDESVKEDAQADMKANALIRKLINPGMTDLEKVFQVFHYVQWDVMYHSGKNDQTAYGALVDGKCVCAGKADAVEMLLGKLNIETKHISGINECNHAWSLVKLNGNYYHLDATMNAFLKSDAFMYKKGAQFWDWNQSLYPKCPFDSVAPQGFDEYVQGDCIYYRDGDSFVKSKMDGSGKSVLFEAKDLWMWGMDGDWCYYTTGRGFTNIYKSSITDPAKQNIKLADNLQVDDFVVAGGGIYYSDFNRNIYKMNPDSGQHDLFKSNPTQEQLKKEGLDDVVQLLN